MRYLFLILFTFTFLNQALATTPPGLFDDEVNKPLAPKKPVPPNKPVAPRANPALKKKVKKDNAPSITIPKSASQKGFVKDENAPLFFEDENQNIEDDSLIPNIEVSNIIDVDKLKSYVDKVINTDDEKNDNTADKDKEKIKPVDEVKLEPKEETPKVEVTPDFHVPSDLTKEDEKSFLDNLFSNFSNVKPKDKKLEELKAKEEEKRKQEELAKKQKEEAEKQAFEKQQADLKAKEELEKQQALKPVKKKSKEDILADKVRSFSVAGFNVGMSPKEVLDFAKLTDFKVKFITKEIPKFLMWRYEQNCKNEKKFTSKEIDACVSQKSQADKSEYVSKITLEHNDGSEDITLLFSTNFSKNSLYKISYVTKGDNSLGYSNKANFIRDQRKLDFLRRVRQRYGDPDDRANMVWGSLKKGVTLRAFIKGFDVNGNVVIEDLSILDDDYITMKRASNKIKRENNFSF